MRNHAIKMLCITVITASLCGCNTEDDGPIIQNLEISKREVSQKYVPTVRTYFIAADEVEWDYAPSGKNLITNNDFTEDQNVFVGNTDTTIGSKYKKAIYRQYTDDTFTTIITSPETEHMGFLGPTIRGVVGDSIIIVFKNNTVNPASVHPHGVFYDKSGEGANYNDGSNADTKGDMVATGDTYTYRWDVPETSMPGPSDPSSIGYPYHSHFNSPKDVNTGLVGMIVIVDPAFADKDAFPTDIDREFFTMFLVSDENVSHYIEDNIATYPTNPALVDPEDDEFVESNLMHGINGYVYGNLPMLTMNSGENVRWYLMAMGTEVDLHTAHWHGATVLQSGNRVDVVDLLPAITRTVDMKAENPGIWLYHCHVNDHINAGMIGRYEIK